MITREFTIIVVHGEGDRDTVNRLEAHRRQSRKQDHARQGRDWPAELNEAPDEAPDVTILLRDAHGHERIEHKPESWAEIEEWKTLAGYDPDKRHWKHGATVRVTFG